jgi:hypothetical protein
MFAAPKPLVFTFIRWMQIYDRQGWPALQSSAVHCCICYSTLEILDTAIYHLSYILCKNALYKHKIKLQTRSTDLKEENISYSFTPSYLFFGNVSTFM